MVKFLGPLDGVSSTLATPGFSIISTGRFAWKVRARSVEEPAQMIGEEGGRGCRLAGGPKSWPRNQVNRRSDKVSRGRKKPLLFSWRAPQGREATMVPVGVWYTSGHEVVQQVRPTGEPDGTTSGPGLTTTTTVGSSSFSLRGLCHLVLAAHSGDARFARFSITLVFTTSRSVVAYDSKGGPYKCTLQGLRATRCN